MHIDRYIYPYTYIYIDIYMHCFNVCPFLGDVFKKRSATRRASVSCATARNTLCRSQRSSLVRPLDVGIANKNCYNQKMVTFIMLEKGILCINHIRIYLLIYANNVLFFGVKIVIQFRYLPSLYLHIFTI